MDSYDATVYLQQLLRKLTSSSRSNEAVLNFIRENADLVEDLYKCIVAELRKNPHITLRASILYCLEQLATAQSSRLRLFREWVARDCLELSEAALPAHPMALANVGHIRSVINWLARCDVINKTTADIVRQQIKRRAHGIQNGAIPRDPNLQGLSKNAILRRMDEDRDRQKRFRQRKKAVNIERDTEFRRAWEALGPLTALDKELMYRQRRIALDSKGFL